VYENYKSIDIYPKIPIKNRAPKYYV